MITKYGAVPQQTSKTASGTPGNKDVKPPEPKKVEPKK